MTMTSAGHTFESVNPATGELVGTFPVAGSEEITEVVARAREGAAWWAGLSWRDRRVRLLAWKSHFVRNTESLAQLIHDEGGKPLDDGKIEVMLSVLHLDWAARHAHRVLGSRRVPSGLAMMNMASSLSYEPLGVVGVIGPWNYPLFTPMGSVAYALAAGNAVIFKPSELTPAVGAWMVSSFSEVLRETFGDPPVSGSVLQLVTGYGPTGSALTASGVDKIAFTGSPGTARKVMATAAASLTPVLAECGGKDALVVDASADLDAAVEAAAWGGMSNAGQTCIGIERVYVHSEIFDSFVSKLRDRVSALRPGSDPSASYGPLTMPAQASVISRHISDALSAGGHAAVGGESSVQPPYVSPVILVDVPESSLAVQEETFGPVLTVTSVESLSEGVRLANASGYALGSSVFSGSRSAAMAAARALRAGMTSVNSVVAFTAVPALPFGGSGESGFGRIHGEDGLRAFARAKSITRQRMRPMVTTMSFSRTPADMSRLVRLITFLHGRKYGPRRRP
jgi:acyl-CoA reductase-like NAD-dependent aldehyde dehydrogenase